MIRVVILDFDGTISDSKKIVYDSLAKTLKEFEYDFDEKILRSLMGLRANVIFRKIGVDEMDFKKVLKKFYKYYTKAALSGEIRPCVSLASLWEMKKDYPLVVVSNSRGCFLRMFIKKMGLRGLFKKVYGADKFFTKDEMIKKVIRKMKVEIGEAVYVGDRFSDVEAAKKAGCVSVAISNKCSWSSLKEIERVGPDFVVKDFVGLKKLVKEID